MKQYFLDFVALFYPELCIGCSEPLPRGVQHICVKCRYDLPKTNNHKLQIEPLIEKFRNIVLIEHLLVYCFYQKRSVFQRIIYHLKYENKPSIGRMLGKWYGEELLHFYKQQAFDFAIPVPLHSTKRKSRGYNQSEMIAEGLADVMDIELIPDALIRKKSNRSLTGLGRVDRMTALRQTYGLNADRFEELKGKRLLLVDDVMTTGSTLIACYEAISAAKPAAISFLVLGAAQ